MLDFPLAPTDGQQYTEDGRTWEWVSSKSAWNLVPVSTTDADSAATSAASALSSKNAASTSESNAATSASAASASAGAASSSATSAGTSATLAQDWATKTSGEVVTGQGYGAKKYAIDAAASAAAAAADVLGKVLTGLSLASGAAITAADTVLAAFGKLQKQITDAIASIALKAPIASPTFTGTISGITKAMVGLGSVDDTTDTDKPVSTAQQTALNLKANLASPSFTGTVSLPTGGTNSAPTLAFAGDANTGIYQGGSLDQIAFTAGGNLVGVMYSDGFEMMMIPSAPTAAAGSSTSQLATTAFVTTANALKANLASPTLTGTPAAPTAAAGTNTTQLATTAFATTAVNTAKTTLELNAQTGTAYTLVLADAGKRVNMSNAAANVLTVPPNSAVAFPVNTLIFVSQGGAGATSIAAGSGVTINTAEGLKVGAQYKMVSIVKTATDTWMGIGTVA